MFILTPTIWELCNDARGDENKKWDVVIRVLLAILGAQADNTVFNAPLYSGVALSLAFHFLVFDYLIVLLLIRFKILDKSIDWFSYLGRKSKLDRWYWWRSMDPRDRLIIRLSIFFLTLITYLHQWKVIS